MAFGNQDTGTIAGTLGQPDTFESLSLADGGNVMIDHTSDDDLLFVYHGVQQFRQFVRTPISKSDGTIGSPRFLSLQFPSNFVGLASMNPSDQRVFAVAVNIEEVPFVVFSQTRGLTFSDPIATSTVATNEIAAMEWSADGNVLFVVHENQDVFLCDASNGTPSSCNRQGNAGTPSFLRHLAVSSTDANTLFAAGWERATGGIDLMINPRAYVSTDAGISWRDITSGGSPFTQSTLGGSVAYISTLNTVVVATSSGVFIPEGAELGSGWSLLASGYPNVPVLDMEYEPGDDTLVVATLGRGIWFVPNVSQRSSSESQVFVAQQQHSPRQRSSTKPQPPARTNSTKVPPDTMEAGKPELLNA